MKPFSPIRFQITLWYALIVLVTLTGFSILVFQIYEHRIYTDMDSLLLAKAEGIESSINTFLTYQGNPFRKANNKEFIRAAQRWVQEPTDIEKKTDPILSHFSCQIFDARGNFIASTQMNKDPILLPPAVFQDILKGKLVYYNLLPSKPPRAPIRVLAYVVTERHRVAYIIQVTSLMASQSRSLRELRWLFIIFVPFMVITTALFGMFLADRTLRPVKSMIDSVSRLSTNNLKTPIPVPQTHDEIQSLAETFNHQLKELDRTLILQNRFIQDASHELKTPLTIMRSEIEVACTQKRSNQEYQALLQSNLEEITKLTQIIESLLQLAQMDSQGINESKDPVELKAEIEKLVKIYKNIAKKIGFIFEFKWNGSESIVVKDAGEIWQRIIRNLLDNAMKFTPPTGHVSCEVSSFKTEIVLIVSDTGVGISEKDLPHIFERFFRSDQARLIEGAGLGLSIVKTMVENRGGSIVVTSKEGQGSTFTVRLPVNN